MMAIVVVQTAVIAVLAVLVAGLLHGYAGVLRRLHQMDGGPEAAGAGAGDGVEVGYGAEGAGGSVAPFRTSAGVAPPAVRSIERRDEWSAGHDIRGVTPAGEIVHVSVAGVEHDTVVAFLSAGCAGCEGFWDELARPGSRPAPPGSRLVVVTKGPQDESPGALADLAAPGVDVVMSSEAWSDYTVPGSPFVVVVDGRTGRVRGEGSGGSFSQVVALLAQANGDGRLAAVTRPAVRKPAADREREADVDRVLGAAGILPGHPSLYAGAGGADGPVPARPSVSTGRDGR